MTTRIDGEITDNDGGDTTVRSYYCGTGFQPVSAWNIVETRNGSNQTTYQYVWGTKYTDELILIDKNLAPTVGNDADMIGRDFDFAYEAAADKRLNKVVFPKDVRPSNTVEILIRYNLNNTTDGREPVPRFGVLVNGRT